MSSDDDNQQGTTTSKAGSSRSHTIVKQGEGERATTAPFNSSGGSDSSELIDPGSDDSHGSGSGSGSSGSGTLACEVSACCPHPVTCMAVGRRANATPSCASCAQALDGLPFTITPLSDWVAQVAKGLSPAMACALDSLARRSCPDDSAASLPFSTSTHRALRRRGLVADLALTPLGYRAYALTWVEQNRPLAHLSAAFHLSDLYEDGLQVKSGDSFTIRRAYVNAAIIRAACHALPRDLHHAKADTLEQVADAALTRPRTGAVQGQAPSGTPAVQVPPSAPSCSDRAHDDAQAADEDGRAAGHYRLQVGDLVAGTNHVGGQPITGPVSRFHGAGAYVETSAGMHRYSEDYEPMRITTLDESGDDPIAPNPLVALPHVDTGSVVLMACSWAGPTEGHPTPEGRPLLSEGPDLSRAIRVARGTMHAIVVLLPDQTWRVYGPRPQPQPEEPAVSVGSVVAADFTGLIPGPVPNGKQGTVLAVFPASPGRFLACARVRWDGYSESATVPLSKLRVIAGPDESIQCSRCVGVRAHTSDCLSHEDRVSRAREMGRELLSKDDITQRALWWKANAAGSPLPSSVALSYARTEERYRIEGERFGEWSFKSGPYGSFAQADMIDAPDGLTVRLLIGDDDEPVDWGDTEPTDDERDAAQAFYVAAVIIDADGSEMFHDGIGGVDVIDLPGHMQRDWEDAARYAWSEHLMSGIEEHLKSGGSSDDDHHDTLEIDFAGERLALSGPQVIKLLSELAPSSLLCTTLREAVRDNETMFLPSLRDLILPADGPATARERLEASDIGVGDVDRSNDGDDR